jgi:hypothetical protein
MNGDEVVPVDDLPMGESAAPKGESIGMASHTTVHSNSLPGLCK